MHPAKREYEEHEAGKDMDVFEDKDECIETIFQQWSQEEIRFFYQEIWHKESQEYETQEAEQRR